MNRAHALLFGIVFLASAALAQMETPKPAPELKKLDFLVGKWVSESEVKPGPMGPGGKVTADEHNEWMEGGYFLVLRPKFTGAFTGSSIAFMGYDPDEKVYTYYEFSSNGEVTHSTGTVNGDTWTWLSEFKMGPKMAKGRYTLKVLSPTAYTFKFEVSDDGTNWTSVLEGKDKKQ